MFSYEKITINLSLFSYNSLTIFKKTKKIQKIFLKIIIIKMPKTNKNNKYYTVRAIEDDRIRDGKIEYLLSWVGYNDIHNSWEDETDMKCNDLIQSYLKAKSEKGVRKKN